MTRLQFYRVLSFLGVSPIYYQLLVRLAKEIVANLQNMPVFLSVVLI